MKESSMFNTNRRQFLSTILPACSMMCLGGSFALAQTQEEKEKSSDEKHKFDKPFEGKLSNRQFYNVRYREYIRLTKALEKEMGKEKLIEFLKNYTKNNMMNYGQSHAKRSPDNTFATYIKTFKNPRYENSLTMEIIEGTEKTFELKVTECIWATTFLNAKAGDIGYASVCFGDYAWAEGFNPNIKMIRDKTLMQGHECCNHRYVWLG